VHGVPENGIARIWPAYVREMKCQICCLAGYIGIGRGVPVAGHQVVRWPGSSAVTLSAYRPATVVPHGRCGRTPKIGRLR
jgi:hypothetical protein